MLHRLLLVIPILVFSTAQADVRLGSDTDGVSVPYTDWELDFPSQGWVLVLQRSAPDGLQFYYLFTNLKLGMNASFYLEPAYKCDNSAACRTLFWKDPGPMFKNPKEVRFLESNKFSVVEFTVPLEGINMRHWSGHLVQDDVWIDMHISAPVQLARDFSVFESFTGKLAVSRKPSCPMCLKLTGLSRQASTVLFAKVRGGDAQSWKRLLDAAEAGDAEAQFMVARVYSWGSPLVKPDETQSASWTRKAAEQGHAEAQSNLAFFLASGRGVDKKDMMAAVRWWTRAAEQGYAPAQLNLGTVYATDSTFKDKKKSLAWTRMAADQGLANAQINLGVAYGLGKGVERDLRAAIDWYSKAAAQGNETAMVNMAALIGLATHDKKQVQLALGILDNPLLLSNERAKTLRTTLCGSNPGVCPGDSK